MKSRTLFQNINQKKYINVLLRKIYNKIECNRLEYHKKSYFNSKIWPLLLVVALFSGNADLKANQNQNNEGMDVEQLVKRLIEENYDVRMAALNYILATSDRDQIQAKYGYYLKGDISMAENNPPEFGRVDLFEGSKQKQRKVDAFIAKNFPSGTSVAVGISTQYIDSGVDPEETQAALAASLPPEMAGLGAAFGSMSQPPYYSSSLVLELRQSLLRNFAGRNDRHTLQILDNVSEQKKIITLQILSGLIVEALSYFWNINILTDDLQTAQDQLNSSRLVRGITIKKLNLGLAENVELMQWDNLIVMHESQVTMARNALKENRRKLMSAVKLPLDTKLNTSASLLESKDLPSMIIAVENALRQRPDMQAARLQLSNAKLAMLTSENEALPELDLVLRGSSQGRAEGLGDSFKDVPGANYPAGYVGLEMTAPLYDTGAENRIRNSKVIYEQAHTNANKLEQNIRDEIASLLDQAEMMQQLYANAVRSQKLARDYYFGVLARYRQGRFSSLVLKQALDNYTQSRLARTRALVGYNVALLRLDFAQNNVLSNYGLDRKEIEALIDKYLAQGIK